jgi:tRNA-binding protein
MEVLVRVIRNKQASTLILIHNQLAKTILYCCDCFYVVLLSTPTAYQHAVLWITMSTFKVASVKPNIPFDLLEKIDVRVGTIERVEDLKGSTKLARLIVNFGDHKRTILAGIKEERENPQEIEGKQALFVVNLDPRKMMGEVSEGMLFDIGYADGITPVLAVPEKGVPNGSRAG